jgi:hypothetical protein
MGLGRVYEGDKTLFSWKKVKSVNQRKCPVSSLMQTPVAKMGVATLQFNLLSTSKSTTNIL